MSGEIHVIVGAGQAGGSAAVAMRRAGFAGRIVLIGDEPHRPYERPPLSKAVLSAPELPPPAFLHAADRYGELAIELMLGTRVRQLDAAARRVVLDDGRSVAFDRLLLAMGGRARRLGVPGTEHVATLRTLDEAVALRTQLAAARRVVCIGAGVIGLELAATARALGCRVTVMEAAEAPMARSLCPTGRAFVRSLHEDHGVELRFGVTIDAVEARADGTRIVCCSGGDRMVADCVVAGIGMQPNVELAAQAGLEVDGGIHVDAHGRTSEPGIYAAGDVAAFLHPRYRRRIRLEAWQHAQNHAIHVARVMCGETAAYEEIPWFWTDQFRVNLQVAGFPGEGERTVVREGAGRLTAFHLDGDGRLVGMTAADNPGDMRAGLALMRSDTAVSPSDLANAALPLRRLVIRR